MKKEFAINFQNLLDTWTKGNLEHYKKKAKRLIGRDLAKHSVFKKIEKNETYHFLLTAYHAQKALKAGASAQLPYATLKLLGAKLSDAATRRDAQEIIESNVLKFKGEFFKLDDPSSQKKIQKALIKKSFCSKSFKQAA